jgi:threonine dehydrogenase-like Zn-dependent dehydrogenase
LTNDKKLFTEEVKKLLHDPRILKLGAFPQHHGSNTLAHCLAVAMRSFEFAEKLGFKTYGGESVDTVIEASGAPAALNDAVEKCAPFGRIVLVGHGKSDVTLGHDKFVKILRKQLTLCGSWNSDFTDTVNDWKESVAAVAEGRISPEGLVTHKFAVEDSPAAFEMIKEGKEFYNKILLVN